MTRDLPPGPRPKIEPKLDYEPPSRPPAARPGRDSFWSPRKWKLYLLAAWAAATSFWIPVAAQRHHMDYVVESYRTYHYYENALLNAADRTYLRQGYRRAEAQLTAIEPYLWAFLLEGIAAPLLILFGGAWLLRNAK